jgi:hypothetical protein
VIMGLVLAPLTSSPGPGDRGPGLLGGVMAGAVAMWNQSLVSPDPVMISWNASGTLVVEHFPADRA